jgi:hypothetical protein
MGLLSLFSKAAPGVHRLPSGTLTVDRDGRILASTVSSGYSAQLLQEISEQILSLFRLARQAQVPLSEFVIHFASLKITAREMRGGAIIFLMPQHSLSPSPQP